MDSDQELIGAMEMYEEDRALLDAVEIAEAVERFATIGDAFYEARENNGTGRDNLLNNRAVTLTPKNLVASSLTYNP